MSLIKAMATVGGLTGVSRIAGFIRDILTAAFLGAGPVADAFFVALKLPNFFRNVTAEGAFSVSFVPLYTETLQKKGEAEAGRFAGQAFSVMLGILSLFTIVMIVAMPWVMYVIAPGFDKGTLRYDLAIDFSRITFAYLLLISLCALMGGMLNAHEKFGPFASTSIFFNLCQIAAMLIPTAWTGVSPGHALAWSVTISGVIQLGRLWWYLKKYGIALPMLVPHITAPVKKLFRLMLPGVMGAGIIHVNLFADIVIASLLSTGAISSLYYADRLFQLPLGVVGIAVGTALLPLLTKALAAGKTTEARDLFNRALEYCLFLTVPAAAALMLVTHDIVSVLFEHGAFTAENTARTSPALACLSLGLPAYVSIKIFSSGYWAQQNTATPVKISASMAVMNIVVALIMTRFIDVAGISLATGLSGWVQCFLLWRGLKDGDATSFDERLRRAVPRIFLCAACMGGALLMLSAALQGWFHGPGFHRILALTILVTGGSLVYFMMAHICGVFRLQDVKKYLRRTKKVPSPGGQPLDLVEDKVKDE